MKYRHYVSFCTDITGDRIMHESFNSDDKVPKDSDVKKCTMKFMKEFNSEDLKGHDSFRLGIRSISTVTND